MTDHFASAAPQPDRAGDDRVPGRVDPVEVERLTQALNSRFAPHVDEAAAAVREAEQSVAEAREALARARRAADGQRYQSDRLVFMRASVKDEAEALTRKTTPKKVRVAYRYLLARAVELAEGEVQGYRTDQAAAERERQHSVEACLAAEHAAVERLDAARAMQRRVEDAVQTARQGLLVMVEKLASQEQPRASA